MAERKAAFAAETKLAEQTAVILMRGEINQDADAALTAVYAAAAQMQPTTVTLDFGGVDYINSTSNSNYAWLAWE